MAKKDESIIVQLTGGQSENVTGSCSTVSYMTKEGRKHLLLEFGGIQGGSVYENYLKNKSIIENTPIKYAEYCIIMHSHSDHTMLLPALIPNGFKGKVIMTNSNYEILKKMLKDSVKIHIKEVDYLKSKGYKVKYLYTERDMYDLFNLIEIHEIEEDKVKLSDEITIRFLPNSHVVAATQLELFIRKPISSRVEKIVYTSDLGNTNNFKYNYFLEETKVSEKASLLMIESTYGEGDRNFSKSKCTEERKDLKKTIKQFVNGGNSVLIPVFSYARLQNMMCWLYDNFKDEWNYEIPIVIDTNLGYEINNVYEKILKGDDLIKWQQVRKWKAFKEINTFDGTMAFLTSKQNALILASSGMICGGKSVLYTKKILGESNSAMLFCGYCGENTLGNDILNSELNKVKVEGEVLLKRCTIKKYNSFSSHASQKDIINYVKGCKCNKVILQHGSDEAKKELKNKLIEELSKMNRTTQVLIAKKDMKIIL